MGLYGHDHILYICLSLPIAIVLSIIGYFLKDKKWQKIYIFIFAVITVGLHYSTLWTSYFKDNGHVYVGIDHLFPIFFCNFIMNLNLILSVLLNRKSRFMNVFATFCGYAGVIGALINLFITEPHFENWNLLQSAISHSTMLVTSLLLFTCGYIKINVYNVVPFSIGILTCGLVAGGIELIFFIMGKPSPNPMYISHGPKGYEVFSGPLLALLMLIALFIFTAIFEAIQKRKDNSKEWFKCIDDLDLYIPIKIFRKKNKNSENSEF